ncbi:SAM-dependent methyltransferase [Streptomyces sp. NPDC059118]|uniref:SAM-dependent methyltransferase n=1 Tax=unclassified Streptomyces TaxID=2593676 RepID=UPI003676F3B3
MSARSRRSSAVTDPRTTPVPDRVRSGIAHDARRHEGRPGHGDLGVRVTALYPGIGEVARAERALPGRAVGYPAGEAGIRRFLDSGTGLADHTPEAAGAAPRPSAAPRSPSSWRGPTWRSRASCRAHWRSEPGAAPGHPVRRGGTEALTAPVRCGYETSWRECRGTPREPAPVVETCSSRCWSRPP